jgi:hypothetical protein
MVAGKWIEIEIRLVGKPHYLLPLSFVHFLSSRGENREKISANNSPSRSDLISMLVLGRRAAVYEVFDGIS